MNPNDSVIITIGQRWRLDTHTYSYLVRFNLPDSQRFGRPPRLSSEPQRAPSEKSENACNTFHTRRLPAQKIVISACKCDEFDGKRSQLVERAVS